MTPELADRIAEGMAPIVAAYLEARDEAERTGQPARRRLSGGSLTVPPREERLMAEEGG